MKRLLQAIVLFFELAVLALAAIAVVAGDFDQGRLFFLALFGALALASLGLSFVLPPHFVARTSTHGLLLVGCVLFVFPFVWLISTSFKYPEEVFIYPPKWIPSTPGATVRSPFVTPELFRDLEPPRDLDRDRWPALWPKIESALWERGRPMLPNEYVESMDSETLRRTVVHGLWSVCAPGVRSAVWGESDDAILAALTTRMDPSRMTDVWRQIQRSMALGAPFLTDTRRNEYALARLDPEAVRRWTSETDTARIRHRPVTFEAEQPPVSVVEYDFSRGERQAVISAVYPLPFSPDDFFSLTLPIHQDRSWNRYDVAIEFDGRRYVNHHGQTMQNYLWQDLTLKRAEVDDRDERWLGIWPLKRDARATNAFDAKDQFKVTVTVEYAPPLVTLWRKYTFNYHLAWIASTHWTRYIFNSTYLVVLTVLGQILSCSMVAYAFARLRWPGRDWLFLLLLATMMLPPQVTMIPVFLIFKEIGWYNTLKPLWVPSFFGSAFFIFMLRQFMKSIPISLEEAARIDGCSYFGIYRMIILPLMKPALAAVGIFTFMGTWNEFMGPLIFVNDQRLYPLALGLFDLRTQHGGNFGLMMAASTLMVMPVIVVFFFAQRYFIEGVTLTGMKN